MKGVIILLFALVILISTKTSSSESTLSYDQVYSSIEADDDGTVKDFTPEIIVAVVLTVFALVSCYVCIYVFCTSLSIAIVSFIFFSSCIVQMIPVLPMGLTGIYLYTRGHRPLIDEEDGESDAEELEETTGGDDQREDLKDVLVESREEDEEEDNVENNIEMKKDEEMEFPPPPPNKKKKRKKKKKKKKKKKEDDIGEEQEKNEKENTTSSPLLNENENQI